MNLTGKNQKETNRYELTFEVPAEDFQKAVEDAYHAKRSRFNVPGFRRGKAPRTPFPTRSRLRSWRSFMSGRRT